jgi:hypothetical protein
MDLVESPHFEAPLIILQTVLDEVRHRSLPLHNRLKALLRADDKRVFVFYNEYHECVTVFVPIISYLILSQRYRRDAHRRGKPE